MEKTQVSINGREFALYRCHTLIIGSGAAALNCAYHLSNFGVQDLLIVTERLGGGTSNNSGSDKQTYYKLSLFGEGQDSVYEMARTLFNGGAMHGDIALVEAALSAQEFYHLVQAGVPFPHNSLGGYVGYKTDHDPKQRATSAGPWTSNQMFQKLLLQVRQQGTSILDQHEVIFLLTIEESGSRRVIGAIAIDKAKAELGWESIVFFLAENIVMGTGGPGGLYATSVYPQGHLGSTGVALEAGAEAVNLTEWQYGLASIKFRWNVSGTYQQVIPRYFSTNQDGSDEREFLNEFFPSMGKLATAIFLKGYQWPFDPRKIKNYGSSLIDILVYQETALRNRRVFLDFRSNPSSGNGLTGFSFEQLEPEAYQYLQNSGALFGTPLERLEKMNLLAIKLYLDHGIDLSKEPLEIAVCAQHNNGGLKGNIWWESNLKHLFPIGEVNGSHGVYRPGGSALNSGQAGGYRAAQYIAERYQHSSFKTEDVFTKLSEDFSDKLNLIARAFECCGQAGPGMAEFRNRLQMRMTKRAAHIRDAEGIKEALQEAEADWQLINNGPISLKNSAEIIEYFQNRQLCLTQLAVLYSIQAYLAKAGGSRGSYLVTAADGETFSDQLPEWKYRPETPELRDYTLDYRYAEGNHRTDWVKVRPIPDDSFWFEQVWNAYLRKEIY